MNSPPHYLKEDIVRVPRNLRDAIRFAENLNEGIESDSKLAMYGGRLCGVHTLLDYKRRRVTTVRVQAWGEN